VAVASTWRRRLKFLVSQTILYYPHTKPLKGTLTALTASAIGYDSYLNNASTACCDWLA
jgi:hypothetical protein